MMTSLNSVDLISLIRLVLARIDFDKKVSWLRKVLGSGSLLLSSNSGFESRLDENFFW